MAELADALALGASGRKAVQVQPLFLAPKEKNPGGRPGFRVWIKMSVYVACTRAPSLHTHLGLHW